MPSADEPAAVGDVGTALRFLDVDQKKLKTHAEDQEIGVNKDFIENKFKQDQDTT